MRLCQFVSLPVRRLFDLMVFNIVCMILGNHCIFRTVMKIVFPSISQEQVTLSQHTAYLPILESTGYMTGRRKREL